MEIPADGLGAPARSSSRRRDRAVGARWWPDRPKAPPAPHGDREAQDRAGRAAAGSRAREPADSGTRSEAPVEPDSRSAEPERHDEPGRACATGGTATAKRRAEPGAADDQGRRARVRSPSWRPRRRIAARATEPRPRTRGPRPPDAGAAQRAARGAAQTEADVERDADEPAPPSGSPSGWSRRSAPPRS